MLRCVEIPLLKRGARQNAQVIHCEGMLLESQPPRVGIGGPGGLGGLGQAAGFEPRERLRAPHIHLPGRVGDRGHRLRRGRLAVDRREVLQPGVGTQQ